MRGLLGIGYEVNTFWDGTSNFNYGSDQGTFLFEFQGGILPYLEAGVTRQRLTFTLMGHIYEPDELSLGYYTPQGKALVTYSYTPWSLSAMLSFRLTTDTAPQY